MKCQIKWDAYTRTQWDELLKKCNHSTLLQSYAYAQAMREVKQQSVRHGMIEIDGVEAGIVQIQEVSLFGKAIHAISIDRGPCWFDGFGKSNHLQAFVDALNSEFPVRFGRRRRFIPELSSKNSTISLKNWKKDQKINLYSTYIINILPEIDILRSNLKKKWRNILNKAEKNNINVQIDYNLETLGVLLHNYMVDRAEKRYAGASPRFLSALAKYSARTNDCMILNALEDDEIIASIMIFGHGKGATYQVGWTTPYGRDKGAHHLLLWHAIETLKQNDIIELDLGGYNDLTEGIKKFKEGLGGKAVSLIGSYE